MKFVALAFFASFFSFNALAATKTELVATCQSDTTKVQLRRVVEGEYLVKVNVEVTGAGRKTFTYKEVSKLDPRTLPIGSPMKYTSDDLNLSIGLGGHGAYGYLTLPALGISDEAMSCKYN